MRIGIGIFLLRRLGSILAGGAPSTRPFRVGDWSMSGRSVNVTNWLGSGSPDLVLIRTRVNGGAWTSWSTLATAPAIPFSVEHFSAADDGLYEAQIRAVEASVQSAASDIKPLLIGEAPAAPWVLVDGAWTDAGQWSDSETWNDGG